MVGREILSREAAGGSLMDAGGDGARLFSDCGDSRKRMLDVSLLPPPPPPLPLPLPLPLPPPFSGIRILGSAYRRGVVGSEDVGEGRERFGCLCVGSASRSGVFGVSEVSMSG